MGVRDSEPKQLAGERIANSGKTSARLALDLSGLNSPRDSIILSPTKHISTDI